MRQDEYLRRCEQIARCLVDVVGDAKLSTHKYEASDSDAVKRNKDRTWLRSVVAVSLVISTLDALFAVLAVLGSIGQTQVFMILRPMQEALADLTILAKDANYIDVLDAADLRAKIDQLEGLLAKRINTGIGDTEIQNIKTLLRELGQRQKRLLDKGVAPGIEPKRKFARADMENEYDVVFKLGSGHAHNSVSSLADRHFEAGELHIGRQLDHGVFVAVAELAVGMAIRAVAHLPSISLASDTIVTDNVNHAMLLLEMVKGDARS